MQSEIVLVVGIHFVDAVLANSPAADGPDNRTPSDMDLYKYSQQLNLSSTVAIP